MEQRKSPTQLKQGLQHAISYVVESKENYVRRPGKDFVRKRKLGMDTIIQLLLSIGGNTLRKELCDWFHYSRNSATVSAFVQQREKVLPSAFETIFHRYISECVPNLEYKGYRLLAVDGSDVRLPADSHNAETYIKTNETDEKGYNLVHLDAMFDLMSHAYVDASIQPKRNMCEHRALTTMIDRSTISNPAIIIADRGYESFNNMAHIIKKGWYFVIRAKDSYGIITKTFVPDCPEIDVPVNVTLTRRQTKMTRMLFEQDSCRYRWLPPKATFDYLEPKSNEMYELAFRVVRVMLSPDNFETIYTNLPVDKFSAYDVKSLYQMRWGVKTAFRELKYSIGLTSIHSKKNDSIVQEIFARLTLFNFSSLLIGLCHCKADNVRINFAAAFLWCRQFLNALVEDAVIFKMLQRCTSPIRPGRNFPRYQKHLSAMSLNYRII